MKHGIAFLYFNKENSMGKIIIVAGVPGAGKSTLLYEAWKRVEKELH